MEEQLEQSKQRLHFCMAVIGGWFGAYMVLRFGHFTSAATVNLLEMLTGAAQENWPLALLRLGGILVYIAAIFLTAWLPRRTHSDLRRWAILIDMAAAAILSLIPADREYAVYFSLFAMAFQWATFASKHGYPCSTIFSTNNLRQFVDAWVQVHLNRDADHTPRMHLYGGTLLSFHGGAVAVCIRLMGAVSPYFSRYFGLSACPVLRCFSIVSTAFRRRNAKTIPRADYTTVR